MTKKCYGATSNVSELNNDADPISIISIRENELTLKCNSGLVDGTIAIFDVQGRLVVSKHIGRVSEGSVFETELPTASGAYILKVADGNLIFAKPIVNTSH